MCPCALVSPSTAAGTREEQHSQGVSSMAKPDGPGHHSFKDAEGDLG